MSNPSNGAPASRGGAVRALAVMVVTPLVSVILSVFLVMCILHFLAAVPRSASGEGTLADPRLLRDLVEPFGQNGTVPVKQLSDVVYYPIPYATPPHLTLTAKAPDRSYVILRQDEFGFAWAVSQELKGVKDFADKLKGARDLTDVAGALGSLDTAAVKLQPGEEFTWEARGVRPFTTQAAVPPYIQNGTFTLVEGNGKSGVEPFPHPYATPPNVTFSTQNIKAVAVAPTAFAWQQIAYQFPTVTVKWTAKGIRASQEQVDAYVKNPPRLGSDAVVTDSGKLAWAPGEQGAAAFTQPFAAAPNVEVAEVIVTEITPEGFKWKHPGTRNPNATTSSANWNARGVLAPGKQTAKQTP